MKKFLSLILLSTILCLSLSAHVECWLGTGFIGQTDKLAPDNKYILHNIDEDLDFIKSITVLGPSLDFSLFPYYAIPIGIKSSIILLFPVGYNNLYYYRSYQGDMKTQLMVSLDYAQMYTSTFGIFLNIGYEYDHYRFSNTNEKNRKEKPVYNVISDHKIFGELGFLTTINNGYFKFGFNYSHSLISQASSTNLIFCGGYRFK